jgi:hypothetical protein
MFCSKEDKIMGLALGFKLGERAFVTYPNGEAYVVELLTALPHMTVSVDQIDDLGEKLPGTPTANYPLTLDDFVRALPDMDLAQGLHCKEDYGRIVFAGPRYIEVEREQLRKRRTRLAASEPSSSGGSIS